MRFHKLTEVSRMLGGTPCYQSLKRWAAAGLIDVSRSVGGGMYLMSDVQIQNMLKQMGRDHADAEEAAAVR